MNLISNYQHSKIMNANYNIKPNAFVSNEIIHEHHLEKINRKMN